MDHNEGSHSEWREIPNRYYVITALSAVAIGGDWRSPLRQSYQ
jgi:hypothetical protein